jgi:hypothetical protein
MDRLDALQRFDLSEELVDLCAAAIGLRHPKAPSFARLDGTEVRTWTDERIVKAVEQMRTWVAEHQRATGQE